MSVAVDVPPHAPDVPDVPGTPAGIRDLATTLYRAAVRCEEVSDTAARPLKDDWWLGEARDGYVRTSRRVGDEHALLSRTAKRVGHAVSDYADELMTHQATRLDLLDRRRRWELIREGLLEDAATTDESNERAVSALHDRAADLRASHAALVDDRDALIAQVRRSDDELRSVLSAASTTQGALRVGGGSAPEVVDLLALPGSPARRSSASEIAAWWANLTAQQQDEVLEARPDLVGRADGLPASVRDRANRILLEEDLVELQTKLKDGVASLLDLKALANALAAMTALKLADRYVDPITGTKPGGQLWLYDPRSFDGDGRVAIGVGDLDTARDVAVRVPGITNDGRDARKLTTEAVNVYQAARYNGDGSSVASMMWLGYDAPDSFTDHATLTEARAVDGGGRFADAIAGLRASHVGAPAHLTAIGHSYGSTTLAHAMTDHHPAVDDVTFVGSPGTGDAHQASDLGVGAGHVWDGRNSHDLVPLEFADHRNSPLWTVSGAGLGVDPSDRSFHGHRFEAEDLARDSNGPLHAHGQYFAPNSESLYNIGRIVDGHPGDVLLAQHTDHNTDPELDRTVHPVGETATEDGS